MKDIDDIREYLIENVFRNPDIMFSDERNNVDLPEIIASLYNCLHLAITGEPYDYMFHWANKVGSWVDEKLFMEEKTDET